MASHSPHSPQNKKCCWGNEGSNGAKWGEDEIGFTDDHRERDLLRDDRREIHKSLDLNYQTQDSTRFDLPSHHVFSRQQNLHKERTSGGTKEIKKRCFKEMEMGDGEENNSGLDLKLSLAQPRVKKQDDSSSLSSSSSSSSSSNQCSCMSNDGMNSSVCLNSSGRKIPSLVLMGCKQCLLYVMVSEADPKCPKCKSSVLIDKFR